MTPQTLKEISDKQVEKFKVSFDEYYFDEDINGEDAFAPREKILNFLRQAIEEAVTQSFEATRGNEIVLKRANDFEGIDSRISVIIMDILTEQREKQDNFLKNGNRDLTKKL